MSNSQDKPEWHGRFPLLYISEIGSIDVKDEVFIHFPHNYPLKFYISTPQKETMARIRYVHIADAMAANPDQPTQTIIHIEKPLPNTSSMSMVEMDRIYDLDADEIVDALFKSLPQATRIRVLKKLMQLEISNNGFFRGI